MNAVALSVAITGRLGQFALDVGFEVPVRGITALFGPSGSGKTTILRCIAGLQRLNGRIAVEGTPWQDSDAGLFMPPYQRAVGYVFQEASLFPHLSVRDNLLFGVRRAKGQLRPTSGGGVDFDGAVQLLGVGHLLQRSTATLSGGERQRVAVGRALLSNPRILLMDEPLSALDAAAKDEVLPYLQALPARLSLPILYVSHDVTEVQRLADRVVLIESGRVSDSGEISDVFAGRGISARALEMDCSYLVGRVFGYDAGSGLTRFEVDGAELSIEGDHGATGTTRRLRIAARDVSLVIAAPVSTTIENVVTARIVSVADHETARSLVRVCIRLGADGTGALIVTNVGRKRAEALALAHDMHVFAQIAHIEHA